MGTKRGLETQPRGRPGRGGRPPPSAPLSALAAWPLPAGPRRDGGDSMDGREETVGEIRSGGTAPVEHAPRRGRMRSEKTQRAILEAASELMLEHGLRS